MSNTSIQNETVPTFFGLALSTQRVLMQHHAGTSSVTDATHEGSEQGEHSWVGEEQPQLLGVSTFPYEALIAATAIVFFRATVRWEKQEPAILRWFFCALLAVLAYTDKSYELIAAVEIFSYVVSWLLVRPMSSWSSSSSTASPRQQEAWIRLFSIAVGAVGSMLVAHGIFGSGILLSMLRWLTPRFVVQTLEYLFPIAEMNAAYDIMYQLSMEPEVFRHMMERLAFVTFHIQVGMGYVGIDFLRQEQSRRNLLIRLDVKEDGEKTRNDATASPNKNGTAEPEHSQQQTTTQPNNLSRRARHFQRGAAPFIFKVALPYMAQIIFYGNINRFAFSCVYDEMHRAVRYRQVFEHDNHLTSMAADSPTSPEGSCLLEQ